MTFNLICLLYIEHLFLDKSVKLNLHRQATKYILTKYHVRLFFIPFVFLSPFKICHVTVLKYTMKQKRFKCPIEYLSTCYFLNIIVFLRCSISEWCLNIRTVQPNSVYDRVFGRAKVLYSMVIQYNSITQPYNTIVLHSHTIYM
jgi:hypothetical protein